MKEYQSLSHTKWDCKGTVRLINYAIRCGMSPSKSLYHRRRFLEQTKSSQTYGDKADPTRTRCSSHNAGGSTARSNSVMSFDIGRLRR